MAIAPVPVLAVATTLVTPVVRFLAESEISSEGENVNPESVTPVDSALLRSLGVQTQAATTTSGVTTARIVRLRMERAPRAESSSRPSRRSPRRRVADHTCRRGARRARYAIGVTCFSALLAQWMQGVT